MEYFNFSDTLVGMVLLFIIIGLVTAVMLWIFTLLLKNIKSLDFVIKTASESQEVRYKKEDDRKARLEDQWVWREYRKHKIYLFTLLGLFLLFLLLCTLFIILFL